MGSLLSCWRPHISTASRASRACVFVLDALLLTVAIIATRASFRSMNLVASSRSKRSRRVLVYGAGAFGQMIVREMRANPHWRMNPVAFIDDDPMKAHRWIVGVPVRGALDQLEATMRRYSVDEVILSSPSINGSIETPDSRGLRGARAAGPAAAHEHLRNAKCEKSKCKHADARQTDSVCILHFEF